MKTDLIFLLVIAAYIGYYLCKKESLSSVEHFAAIDDARKAVREIYNADVEAIRNLSEVAKKLQAGGLTHPGTFFIRGGDMVMNGGNNWVFHTPDDGRRTMYITPSGTYNQENWNWGAATEMNQAGNIKPGNDIVMRAGKTIFGDGRVHMSGPELLYILHKAGVVIGKEWGGNGNLSVQGDTRIGGNITTNGRTSFGGNMSEGIVNIRNRNGTYTHFNWPDGQNYIRGNTIVDGALVVNGRNILAELDDLRNNTVRKDKNYMLRNRDHGNCMYYASRNGDQPRMAGCVSAWSDNRWNFIQS